MAQWSTWNWIAYGCLSISAFGIALGTIFQKYPQMVGRMPSFFSSPLWSFIPAIFLILASVIFIWRIFISPKRPSVGGSITIVEETGYAPGARLRVLFTGDHQLP